MDKNVFDGFTVNVFLDEDGDYLAHFVEMPNVSAFSDTPEDALKELAMAWKGVKESYRKHREPIPQAPSREEGIGQVSVPIDAQLYQMLKNEAAHAGISLHALVAKKLGKSPDPDIDDSRKSIAAAS
jgi:predicted RNase H-like HicB family nuclease